jgi:hypothetical protein
MDRYVAQQNLQRFQDMLTAARDPAERERLTKLIEHEHERLSEAIQRERDNQNNK